jgi:hypothetical protein
MLNTMRSLELGRTAVVALLVALVAASGCSSEESCEEDKTCAKPGGSGGSGNSSGSGQGDAGATQAGAQAGESGEGGTTSGEGGTASAQGGTTSGGGEGGMPECASDDDCDDGLYCNGVEECVSGACEPGEAHCTNVEDPSHCAATCAEGASGSICGVEPLDADGDGHGDAACVQNPGDDCNDSAIDGADIHPDADETCNAGVDDDCDGEDETTDEVLLAGSSQVLVPAVGTTLRDHVSIAAIPTGGFGVVWADERSGTKKNVYYRRMLADGSPSTELLLSSDAAYYNNDYPDIVVLTASQSEFYVGYQAQKAVDDDGLMLGVEVAFNGSTKENPVIIGESYSRPQLSVDIVYYISDGSDDRASFCAPNGGGCNSWGAQPDAFYAANTLHSSRTSSYVVYERDGDLVLKGKDAFSPEDVAESTPETRTNPLVTENGDEALIAYRYDDGMRVGTCEFADGIPIDLTTTGSESPESVFLYWDPAQTAIYVRTVSPDCAMSPSALVAEEDGTLIGSAAVAVDANGVVGVVWSSQDTTSGQWTIMSRVFSPALCE